jgi:KDO2-lipid IV(A) lauroyltransferase
VFALRHLILAVIKLVGLILYWMPGWFRNLCGDFIGLLWFDVVRLRRRLVLDHIGIAFPEWDRKRKLRVARKSMRNLGRGFVEFLIMPYLDREWMQKNVIFHGMEKYDRVLEGGKGVLILTLHLGSVEFGLGMLSLYGMDANVIVKPFANKLFHYLWNAMRATQNTRFIPNRGSTKAIFRALGRNGAVLFVMDQWAPPSIGIPASFFGREVGTGFGLALIASKRQTPVLSLYVYRDENGVHNIVVGEEIPLEEQESRQKTIAHMTEKYNRELEEIIRRHPDHWMWLHRRWKD